MIRECITMSAPPFGSASPSFGLKASKAQKPRMLILLVICIHDKALCIQLTNVQISFTELKSSFESPSLRSGARNLTDFKIKSPSLRSGARSLTDFKTKIPSLRSGARILTDKTPSGQISRAPFASLRSKDSN